MNLEDYGTMQVLGKLNDGDKIIKMKFVNTAYVLTTCMTLVSSTKLIKEGYDRDMHAKTLVQWGRESYRPARLRHLKFLDHLTFKLSSHHDIFN